MKKLYWIWHENRWTLAIRCEHNPQSKFQPIRLDTSASEVWQSSVIEGPVAGEIKEAPKRNPTFICD